MLAPVLLLSLAVVSAGAQSALPEVRLVLTEVPDVGQYFFYKEAKTWAEGMNYCALEGGHMAVANTVAQADALKSLLTANNVASVHIGLHDKFTESRYASIDGGVVSTSSENWAPGFPTNTVVNNCGGFNKDGMIDIDCATVQPTICQLRSWSSYTLLAPHGLYNLHVEQRTWQAAWEICRGEGGHLWVVDTFAEARDVSQAFPHITDFSLGVHRIAGDDAFTNVFGKPLNATGFALWETGFPFGTSSTRPYVALKSNNGTPTLWTNTASGSLSFVCEHAIA